MRDFRNNDKYVHFDAFTSALVVWTRDPTGVWTSPSRDEKVIDHNIEWSLDAVAKHIDHDTEGDTMFPVMSAWVRDLDILEGKFK